MKVSWHFFKRRRRQLSGIAQCLNSSSKTLNKDIKRSNKYIFMKLGVHLLDMCFYPWKIGLWNYFQIFYDPSPLFQQFKSSQWWCRLTHKESLTSLTKQQKFRFIICILITQRQLVYSGEKWKRKESKFIFLKHSPDTNKGRTQFFMFFNQIFSSSSRFCTHSKKIRAYTSVKFQQLLQSGILWCFLLLVSYKLWISRLIEILHT